MKRLRRQFDAARQDYDDLSFDGNLGDLVPRDEPFCRIAWVRWLPVAAAAAVIALAAVIAWRTDEPVIPKQPVVTQTPQRKSRVLPKMSVVKSMNLPKVQRVSNRLPLKKRPLLADGKTRLVSMSLKPARLNLPPRPSLRSTVQSKLKLRMKSLTPLRRYRPCNVIKPSC